MSRILFILHLPPPVHGSSVVGLQIRESEIIHRNWKPTFINLNTSSTMGQIGRISLGKFRTYAGILWKTLFSLIFHRPSLAYVAMTVRGGGFFKDCGVIALIKIFRVPLVYHLHNKGVSKHQDRWPYKWLYPWVFRNSRVILLSKNLYSDICKFVSKSRVKICPNGIPDVASAFKRDFQKNDVPIILFLSNLIESKGVYVLLDACAILKERGVSFRAEFVGGEGNVSVKAFREKVRVLGIETEVTYLGRRSGAKKYEAFANADIFALPSYNETFGLVNLEAMQWQLPVVATPEGGIPDVVIDGKTGYLVPQRDSEALAEALQKLIQQPEIRKRMGETGRKYYVDKFSDNQFEEKLRDILNTFLIDFTRKI